MASIERTAYPRFPRTLTIRIAQEAAAMVETRIDIINITIEELIRHGYELSVFRTLDDISEQAHAAAGAELHGRIAQRLSASQRKWLDQVLQAELPARRSLCHKIKRSAKKASRKHLGLVIDQLQWLESLSDCDTLLDDVSATKLKHMADMAGALEAGNMKEYRPSRRHALILALIHQMRIGARDDIVEMFICRIGAIHKSAKEELDLTQSRQRALSEQLAATSEQVA